METYKLDKQIEKDLFSANTNTAISAVKAIKETGNKLYLPILFDLLISEPEEELKSEIKYVLGSVKKRDTVPIFIDALKTKKYKPIRKSLLVACWQNGLDFRNYLPLFVDIIVDEDWETGFEAFTVVENMEQLPEKVIIDETLIKIENALNEITDKKRYFLQEILMMIQ